MVPENSQKQSSQIALGKGGYEVSANYYDCVYENKHAPDDQGFYLRLAEQCGGEVLELGCGTGRITLPLAKAGNSVTAVDLSPSMLSQLNGKLSGLDKDSAARVTVVEGDMRNVDLGKQFGLVITPFRSFQHLLEVEDQRQCLANVLRHLKPQGRFVLNLFNPSIEYIANAIRQGAVWHDDGEFPLGKAGVRVRRAYLVSHDTFKQVISIVWRYEEFTEDDVLTATHLEDMQLRWLYRFEAEHLLKSCGFEIVDAYKDYDMSPLDGAKELIYVCRNRS